MSDPLVSVVVPTYGRSWGLVRALDSVFNQSYKNIEVIVVDDNVANSEHVAAVKGAIKKYAGRGVRYIKTEVNSGGSIARNVGVSVAKGELITFLDDDDFYLKDKIRSQVEVFLRDNVDICLCGMTPIWKSRKIRYISSIPVGVNLKEMILFGNVYTPMIMCTKNIFEKVGGFYDCRKFQDHILMIRMLAVAPKVGVVYDELFVHSVHLGERISNQNIDDELYKVRHEFENRYSGILNAEELNALKYRQRRQNLRVKVYNNGWKQILPMLFNSEGGYTRADVFFALKIFSSLMFYRYSIFRSLRNYLASSRI